MARRVLALLVLLAFLSVAPLMAADDIHLSVDASRLGPKIDRNLFGQFAENLGHGLYEGIWIGPDSSIPNTRGIRNDVVAALKELKVPNVRWPGGCFADQYHWRKGIGSRDKRPATVNSAWGDVIDTNAFGTDEFMGFINQIGSTPYVSINVGSGTPEEAAEWLEYMTVAAPTALAKERASNGHPEPYKVGFLGIGNESWDCGGAMTPDYYVSLMKVYSRFVLNMNPAQRSKDQMLKIAVGPGTPDTQWTEAVMKAWKKHTWAWDVNGVSLHLYTVPDGWPPLTASEKFGLDDYVKTIKSALFMDEFLGKQEAVMDKYDPEKKVTLSVDEWGVARATAGIESGFPRPAEQHPRCYSRLSQPEHLCVSRRSRPHGEHSPDDQCPAGDDPNGQGENGLGAHLLRLQNVRSVSRCDVHSCRFRCGNLRPWKRNPAARRRDCGKGGGRELLLEITNLNAENPAKVDVDVTGIATKSAKAETLAGVAVDSINTFDSPSIVVQKATAVRVQNGKLSLTVAPRSVTVVSIEP